MTKKTKKTTMTKKTKPIVSKETISLASLLSKKATHQKFKVWIVGDTPIISHAWSQKNRRQILENQVGALKPAKVPRDPYQDFIDSLYDMGNGTFGFPTMGIKKCIVAAAHKDKGVNKTTTQQALWLNGNLTRIQPAFDGAICDMPLSRLYGTDPQMREDPVKVGGQTKGATLAYRGQFTSWGIRITGRLNISVLTLETLAWLLQEAGTAYGLGDWRNEKSGMFGAYHVADVNEEKEWEKFAAGKGEIPELDLNQGSLGDELAIR